MKNLILSAIIIMATVASVANAAASVKTTKLWTMQYDYSTVLIETSIENGIATAYSISSNGEKTTLVSEPVTNLDLEKVNYLTAIRGEHGSWTFASYISSEKYEAYISLTDPDNRRVTTQMMMSFYNYSSKFAENQDAVSLAKGTELWAMQYDHSFKFIRTKIENGIANAYSVNIFGHENLLASSPIKELNLEEETKLTAICNENGEWSIASYSQEDFSEQYVSLTDPEARRLVSKMMTIFDDEIAAKLKQNKERNI